MTMLVLAPKIVHWQHMLTLDASRFGLRIGCVIPRT